MKQSVAGKALMKLASSLERAIYPFSRWLSILSMLFVVAMMFLIAADVFMRRVLNLPIFGAYEAVKVLLVMVVFCAVAYVMSAKGHIGVDSLTRLYPKKLQMVVAGIVHVLSMAILALICWRSTAYGWAMLQAGEKFVLLRIPVSPFIFLVAFGCVVFFLVILVQFIYTLAGVDEDSGSTSHSC